jgi:hypothetical protein
MKVCSKCKQNKELNFFNKDKKSKDGHTYWCKKCLNSNNNIWVENNYEYNKNWYKSHPEYAKEKYLNLKATKTPYIPQTKEQKKEYARNYQKRRKLEDPIYKLSTNLRVRIRHAFKGQGWKKGKTEELLGCKYEKALNHVESLFQEGMNWDNHGEWHIDHKIPLSSAKTEKELIGLCHYTNLQPLWALDNLKKGNKIL